MSQSKSEMPLPPLGQHWFWQALEGKDNWLSYRLPTVLRHQ